MSTFLQLINKLRNRFNEPAMTSGTFATAIGFDQYCKEAINYAYHDILNAEMEWPFLHQSTSLNTVPGVQFYSPTLTPPSGFTSPAELKEIDWDSFYINTNETVTTITNEAKTIPATSPYTVNTTNIASWQSDLGVKFSPSLVALAPVTGDPAAGQYTIIKGQYIFNATDAGKAILISYLTGASPSQASVIQPRKLTYLDYDAWRQKQLEIDLNQQGGGSAQQMPNWAIRSQKHGEILLSPMPDKIYQVFFEYWLDGLDLSASTDVSLLPTHFEQVLIDGATKYIHEFREDPTLSGIADKRFTAGIARMRTELINREIDMRTGFYWYPSGVGVPTIYTSSPR